MKSYFFLNSQRQWCACHTMGGSMACQDQWKYFSVNVEANSVPALDSFDSSASYLYQRYSIISLSGIGWFITVKDIYQQCMSLVDHSTAIWIVPLQAIYDHVVDLTTVRIAALHWKYSANTRSLEGHTWIKEEIKLYPLSQSFGRQSIVPLVLWSTVSLVLYVGGSLLKWIMKFIALLLVLISAISNKRQCQHLCFLYWMIWWCRQLQEYTPTWMICWKHMLSCTMLSILVVILLITCFLYAWMPFHQASCMTTIMGILSADVFIFNTMPWNTLLSQCLIDTNDEKTTTGCLLWGWKDRHKRACTTVAGKDITAIGPRCVIW